MARYPDSEIARLKRETDLVALVQAAGVALRRHGADLVGRCPFHDDQGPSLVVTPSKQLWHCLGACQAGGSAIDWVMRTERVSFRHAVELLRTHDHVCQYDCAVIQALEGMDRRVPGSVRTKVGRHQSMTGGL